MFSNFSETVIEPHGVSLFIVKLICNLKKKNNRNQKTTGERRLFFSSIFQQGFFESAVEDGSSF